MPARVTGPVCWRKARSIIAVTANRPFVVSLMDHLDVSLKETVNT
jgi:hypothetical protein